MASTSAPTSDRERLSEIGRAVRSDGGSPTESSALLVRLARSLGIDPRTLAIRMEGETVRRTKYPILEEQGEDGKMIFKPRIIAES